MANVIRSLACAVLSISCLSSCHDGTDSGGSPKGAVIAFALKACPPGWKDYTLAYGRFVLGVDNSKADTDPKTRSIGSTQEDAIKSQKIDIPNDVYDGGNMARPGSTQAGKSYAYTYGNRTIDLPGGDETRPKNVALLYCEKN